MVTRRQGGARSMVAPRSSTVVVPLAPMAAAATSASVSSIISE